MDASESERRNRRLPRRWSVRLVVVAALLVVIGAPVAWATHTFADVPTASPHHDDVSALYGARITTGCAPDLYCPGDPVRRDQMASFLRGGLGRAAASGVGVRNPLDPTFQDVVTAKIRTGGSSGGTGFVIAFAYLDAHAFPGVLEAPANIAFKLVQDNGTESFGPHSANLFPAGSVHSSASGSMTWLFEVDTGVIETFRLQAKVTVGAVPGDLTDVDASGHITLLYVPFLEVVP